MGRVEQMSSVSIESRQRSYDVEQVGGDGQPGDMSGQQRLRHDLRQSLSLVMLLASIVDRQPLDSPDIRASLDQIANEVGYMSRVVRGNVGETETELVDVGDVVASIWSSVAQSQRGQLRLMRESDAFVRVDPLALGRSVRNLVENAVRAADGGVIEVRVVSTAGTVLVEVGDSGPGFGLIPPQQRLGLVTVRRFASASGGSLEIGTSPLGGALLRLAIPRVQTLVGTDIAPDGARTTA